MKKLFAFCCIVTLFLFMGCLSTNTTFGTEQMTDGNLVITYDDFQEITTVKMKKYIGFPSKKSLGPSLAIYPYLVHTDSLLTCRLVIELYGVTSRFDRIIFVTEQGKYTLSFSSLNQKQGWRIPNNQYSAYVEGDYIITDEQFKILGEIINASNLKVALYTTDNRATEFTECSNQSKQMFNELFNYYEINNLSELFINLGAEIEFLTK